MLLHHDLYVAMISLFVSQITMSLSGTGAGTGTQVTQVR